MPNTVNYSWPTPADTDLVKNGADAIRDLGDAADTTVKSVADGRGLIHINTTSFSAVASQSINDVFSTTYDNYKIIIVINSQTGGATDVALRLRVSGSDNSTAGNYRWSGTSVASNGTTVTGLNSGASESIFRVASIDQQSYCEITLFNPFATQETSFVSIATDMNTTPVSFNSNRGGQLTVTTSYTGFTILNAGGGNITGNVSVYGYKK